MAKCNCGTGSKVRLSAQPCNAAGIDPTGAVLVPRSEVAGVAPGTATGTDNSVDVYVTPPAADACPEVWTVRAQLTPVSGEVTPTSSVDLRSVAENTFVDVPGFMFTAPQTGVYHLAADVSGTVSTTTQQQIFNWVVLTRMTINGTPITGTDRVVIQEQFRHPAGQTQAAGSNGSATVNKIIQLAAGDIVQVQGAPSGKEGAADTAAIATFGRSLMSWHKVGD